MFNTSSDENSMLGQHLLFWVERRLRQATGNLNVCLGGLSVIMIGDFGQLPPVGDKPLYTEDTPTTQTQAGHTVYKQFTKVVILRYCDRTVQVIHSVNYYISDFETVRQQWKIGIYF